MLTTGRKIPRMWKRAIPSMDDSPPKYSPAHHHPLTVAAVVGSFAMAVGLVVRVSGILLGAENALLEFYRNAGFPLDVNGQPWWAILVLLVLTYGLTFLLLEVPGLSRRLLIATSFLVLMASASPVAALWGVFWSPVVAVLCAGWSAICVILWTCRHPMPCERGMEEAAGDEKVIPISEEQGRRTG